MAAVVGLVPITGIPLPLISAGGSALIPTLFAIGMLAAFARNEPAAAEALALRRSRRQARRAAGLFGRWRFRRQLRAGVPAPRGKKESRRSTRRRLSRR
jgi:cell division protein FtsW